MSLMPPSNRSKVTSELDEIARAGRFALQVCRECGKVQYPSRDACFFCLSAELEWRDLPAGGRLLAQTTVRSSAEPYFQARVPFSTAVVLLDCGPSVVCFLDGECGSGERVVLDLALDEADRAVFTARAAR